MKYRVDVSGRTIEVDLESASDGALRASVDGRPCEAEVATQGDSMRLRVGEVLLDLVVERRRDGAIVLHGRGASLAVPIRGERDLAGGRAAGATSGPASVRAPMPGRVAAVLVAPGADVAAGAPVVVVEAMKMENELRAPTGGKVLEVRVEPGQNVEAGEELVRIG